LSFRSEKRRRQAERLRRRIEVSTAGDRTFFTKNVLSDPVDPATARASCNNGVLKIELGKQKAIPRKGTEVNIE
jgi:HSP20 family molecular chaperone IbpA